MSSESRMLVDAVGPTLFPVADKLISNLRDRHELTKIKGNFEIHKTHEAISYLTY